MLKESVHSEIRTYSSLESASLAAADLIEQAAVGAVRERGFFSLVLAGGSTPRLLYRTLAAPPHGSRLSWQKIHVFWGDERCLPPDRPESNFAMAKEELLDQVIVPAENVHRIRGEVASPAEAAEAYEQELRGFFEPHEESTAGGFPRFDLVLLGMGEDGHTASLFPGSGLLEEEGRWAAATEPRGKPVVARVTLTLPVLNSARTVLFLVAGPRKKAILDEITADPQDAAARYPAARVRPTGQLFWLHAKE